MLHTILQLNQVVEFSFLGFNVFCKMHLINSNFAYSLEQIFFSQTGSFGSQSNMHTPNKFYSFLNVSDG